MALDPTFRYYDRKKAAAYATLRPDYSSNLYDIIIGYHTKNGGSFEATMDVGCGTGNVTRTMAAHFDRAVGVDPGEAMIAQAKAIGGSTKAGAEIEYEILAAEHLASKAHASVDVLTAGMAAHWFHMDRFWPAAGTVIKPGGTVALWTHSSLFCHPDTPNAAHVQRELFHLEHDVLGPFELPANRRSHNMYDDLPLPWELDQPVPVFSQAHAARLEWNRGGSLDGQPDFFVGSTEMTLGKLAQGLGTSSMVTRWREANPQLSGTDQDCVTVAMDRVARAICGEDSSNVDLESVKIRVASSTVLLLFTRLKDEGVLST